MHVVLTGATGLIGSAVVPQLVARGDRVTALVRNAEALEKVEAAGATGALIDFGDRSAIAAAFAQADAVIHLAAAGDDAEAFDRRVAEAAVQALGGTGKPYVHTGGVWVYGSGDDLTEERPYDAPAITVWRLGVIESLEAADLALTVVHPGIVYGNGGTGIPQLLAGQPRGDDGSLTTLGSGLQHWTTVHVDDLAALYVAVIADGTGHGAVLGVSGVNPTVSELSTVVAGDAGVTADSPEATKERVGRGLRRGAAARPAGDRREGQDHRRLDPDPADPRRGARPLDARTRTGRVAVVCEHSLVRPAVRRARRELAADREFCDEIAGMTNAAYAIGEAGMWMPATPRTTAADVAELVVGGELLVAEVPDGVVGCVRVHRLAPATWGFGMLAVAPSGQGSGIGGALVDAAEQHAQSEGATTMQLEILTPTLGINPSKARLQSWYAARGYSLVSSDALEDHHAELVPLLAVSCTYDIWQKPLAPV